MIKKADKAQLTIKAEERLSSEHIGIEMAVKVLSTTNEPISGHPFKVHVGKDILAEGLTDEQGNYNGQCIVNLQEGTQGKVFLVLEGSSVSDWKVVGESKKEPPQILDLDITVLDAAGKPLTGYPFKVQVEHDGPLDATTNKDGEYHHETVLGITGGTKKKVSLVLKVVTVLPKEGPTHIEILDQILCGKRPVQKGEEFKLDKKTHRVTGDILVEEGASLIVEPGAVLEFQEGTGILCKGLLKAVGTKEEPILFKATESHWGNITLFGNGAQKSELQYCVIRNGRGRNLDTGKAALTPLPYNTGSSSSSSKKDCGGGGLLLLSTDEPLFGFNDDEIVERNKKNRITLKNLLVNKNQATWGGGIYCYESSPLIEGCIISSNETVKGTPGRSCDGGGVSVIGSMPEFRNVHIHANATAGNSWGQGGGIYALSSTLTIEGSEFIVNTGDQGGAISLHGTNLILKSSKIQKNCARGRREKNEVGGGGIQFTGGSLIIEGTEITENRGNSGGGLFIDGKESSTTIRNCTIDRNVAEFWGGGIGIKAGKLHVNSSKVNGNSTRVTNSYYSDGKFHVWPSGGGIDVQENSEVVVEKSEICKNASGHGGGIAVVSSTVLLTSSTVDANTALHGIGNGVYIKSGELLATIGSKLCAPLGNAYDCATVYVDGSGIFKTVDTQVVGKVLQATHIGAMPDELSLKGVFWVSSKSR